MVYIYPMKLTEYYKWVKQEISAPFIHFYRFSIVFNAASMWNCMWALAVFYTTVFKGKLFKYALLFYKSDLNEILISYLIDF